MKKVIIFFVVVFLSGSLMSQGTGITKSTDIESSVNYIKQCQDFIQQE